MKLEVGIYKVQRKDYSESYGKKHPRPNSNMLHILTVKKEGGMLVCYLDHSMQAEPPDRFEDYEIVSRFFDRWLQNPFGFIPRRKR